MRKQILKLTCYVHNFICYIQTEVGLALFSTISTLITILLESTLSENGMLAYIMKTCSSREEDEYFKTFCHYIIGFLPIDFTNLSIAFL